MCPTRKRESSCGRRSSPTLVVTMTVEANLEEELKTKEVPPQEEEDEEVDEPDVAPGAGKFLRFDMD